MSWAAVIAGGLAVTGSVISAQGAKKAGEKAAQGSDAAIAEARRQFDLTRGDLAPYQNIGRQALNALGSIYGYSPTGAVSPDALASGTPVTSATVSPTGFRDSSIGQLLTPNARNTLLMGLEPTTGTFNIIGNAFRSKKGDEKRNLNAFLTDNQVYDLGNGMVGLADGTQFPKEKLEEIAGHWYGATYAPDGNQAGWQQSYNALIAPYKAAAPSANVGASGGGLTSDGVQQGFPAPTGGAAALSAPDYSAFFKSPDYEFRRSEGLRDVGNAFSASGGAKSGNALKALAEFNSNLAAGEFGNYFNRQAALAGIGQTATNTSAQVGANTSANIGNALMTGADARASGVAGKYNAISSGLSDLALGAGYWNAGRRNQVGPQALNWGYGRIPPGSYA